jgi:peptidoglycan/xylan/chitin deacetylase (PgdA/CDA1 family)
MRLKHLLAESFHKLHISDWLLDLQRILIPGGHIRIINYHGTPEEDEAVFEQHLAFYARRFSPVSLADLDRFFRARRWEKPRPGLIVTFDDGLVSNYSIAAPMLEKYGFCGWFFIPVDFIDAAAADQVNFARAQRIGPDHTSLEAEQPAMTWGQVRDLDRRGHVIGSHTRSHLRLAYGFPEALLEYEVITSKSAIERALGHACECFCWVGGEEESYSTRAAQAIRRAGYRYAFTTNSAPITRKTNPMRMERNSLRPGWPVAWASFEMCGLQDLRYWPKRARVARMLETR